jgi:hypothetical protein
MVSFRQERGARKPGIRFAFWQHVGSKTSLYTDCMFINMEDFYSHDSMETFRL